MHTNTNKTIDESQGGWRERQLYALGSQYDLIPVRALPCIPGAKPKFTPAKYANGEKYPIEHIEWSRASPEQIGIRLNRLVLVDWDGYKPDTVSLETLAEALGLTVEVLWASLVQWNSDNKSLHFLFVMPEAVNLDEYKQANNGKWLKGVDIKTGNQLVYLKSHKENYLDVIDPAVVPAPALAALKIEGSASTHVNTKHTLDAEAVRTINKCDPDAEYDDWMTVITGTVDQYGKGEDVINTLDEWSSKSAKYSGRAEIESKVRSITRGGGKTWGSVKHMAGETRAQVIPIRQNATEAFKDYQLPPDSPKLVARPVHIPMMIDHHGYETKQTRAGTFPTKTRANLEKVLDDLGLVIAINTMNMNMDVLRGDNYDETQYEVLYSELVDRCERTGLPLATIDLHLKATAVKRSYHPVEKALHGKHWDGVDRVSSVLACMPCENPEFRDLVMRKWLISAMAAIYVQNFFTKLVPVIKGGQTSYKTSFLERVCSIVPNSFANGQPLDTDKTDSIRSAVSKHVVELGEMESTTKKDMGQLKSFITRTSDAFRVPYDKSETIKPRQTVFIGSVNVDNFLRDSTGNDRFPVIELTGRIDIDRANEILGYSYAGSQAVLMKHENLIQFWLQVKHWLDSGERWDLTTSELELSASINSKYAARGPYYLAIEDTLETRWSEGFGFTAQQVCKMIDARTAEDARVRADLDHIVRDGKLTKKRQKRGWVYSLA